MNNKKTYKKFLKEGQYHAQSAMAIPRMGMPSADDGTVNLYAIENPVVVDRINAALAHINTVPTIDAKARVIEIKKALSQAGLDFDSHAVQTGEEGTSEVILNQFGGRVGMTPEEGYVNDDGISHKTGGVRYSLQFTFTKGQGGQWGVDSMIMPLELSESFDPEVGMIDFPFNPEAEMTD